MESKNNQPFNNEDVVIVAELNLYERRQATLSVPAIYKKSEARRMLIGDFNILGLGEQAEEKVNTLLTKGFVNIVQENITKIITCREVNVQKITKGISEKSKEILRSKGWNGACDVNIVAHLVILCGYDVDAYYFFQEQKYAFRLYELKDNEEACIGCSSDYKERFNSPWEEEDGLLYDTISEAYEAGVNYAVENYIANRDFDFSKV